MRPTYDRIITPALERFAAEQSQQRCVPFSSFYPEGLGEFSDYAIVAKAEPELIDFRYLFIGEWVERMFDANPTGQLVADVLPDEQAQDALFSYSQTISSAKPVLEQRRLIFNRFVPFSYNRLMLPLSDNGEYPTHVLVYIAPSLWWAKTRMDLRLRDREQQH